MVEGIGRHKRRFHHHHILLTVVDKLGRTHAETVVVEILLVQQEVAILHEVHDDGLHRTTYHLDAQGVARLLTEQTAAFDDGHTVARRTTAVGRFIHILYTLGHIDIVATLHGRLAIEALQ